MDAYGDILSERPCRVAAVQVGAPGRIVAEDFDYLPPGLRPGQAYGPATGWQHGNGLTTDIDYNQDYRIADIDVADMNEIMSLTYRYNDVANILEFSAGS